MKLSDFFSSARTKRIVINSDIDGLLSGMLLQKYYDCEIVGFSNSKDAIWLKPEVGSLDEPIYIDIFINKPNVFCIDQHVVAYDKDHLERLLSYGTKLNPNLDISKRTFIGDLGRTRGYFNKYPFGTVHYLIALMKQDGLEIKLGDLNKRYKARNTSYSISLGEMILRADDALTTSLSQSFKENAFEWWNKLSQYDSHTIQQLKEFLYSHKTEESRKIKENATDFFIKGLYCDGPDGAFNNVTKTGETYIQDKIQRYIEAIGEMMDIKLIYPREVLKYCGKYHVEDYSQEAINKAYTYAFVFGPNREKHFSYTTDFEKVVIPSLDDIVMDESFGEFKDLFEMFGIGDFSKE